MKIEYFALAAIAVLHSFNSSPVLAKQVDLDVAMAYPTMLIEDDVKKGTNHVRIAIKGFELPSAEERQPVNVAIVIDKSGSMQGDKIAHARRAAIQAVERLRGDDIVSIITYDSTVHVLVPATKASDRDAILEQIRSITAGGNTALFAGVSKGAAETRKFLDDNRVNRVILLSDGLANVGPSSPSELAQLGESLIKEGISVTTMGLGLGYNEDLLSQLSLASSGNHVFIEDAENLAGVFQKEFDDVMSVVAQKLHIKARLTKNIRPVKVLNYPADISGQDVSIDLGQLYAGQERYFVLEVEVPYGEAEASSEIANVELEYNNMVTETQDRLTSNIAVRFSNNQKIVQERVRKDVLSSVVLQIANARNKQATYWRDQGKIKEAKEALLLNCRFLDEYSKELNSEELGRLSNMNRVQSTLLNDRDWFRNRKAMRGLQYEQAIQQRFSGSITGSTGQQLDRDRQQTDSQSQQTDSQSQQTDSSKQQTQAPKKKSSQ